MHEVSEHCRDDGDISGMHVDAAGGMRGGERRRRSEGGASTTARHGRRGSAGVLRAWTGLGRPAGHGGQRGRRDFAVRDYSTNGNGLRALPRAPASDSCSDARVLQLQCTPVLD